MVDSTVESVNKIRLYDFHKSLDSLPQVESLAKYYKVSKESVINKLRCRVVVRRYKDKAIKNISLRFLDETSQILVDSTSTFKK